MPVEISLSNLLVLLLFSLSIRFFWFDFYLFKKINKAILPKKLLECQFCQGFWSTILVQIFYVSQTTFVEFFLVAFCGAFASITFCVFTDKYFDEWEDRKENSKNDSGNTQ